MRVTPRTHGASLVTGVSRYLGAQVAARLAADPRIDRVVGLDPVDPPPELADAARRRRARPRRSAHAAIGAVTELDAERWCTWRVLSHPTASSGGRAAMKEQNVIGTMQLLAACQQAPGLRKLVVRSSTAAYGASFRDPAVFTEDTEPREVPRGGFARDILDIEGYVRGFRRRRPDVDRDGAAVRAVHRVHRRHHPHPLLRPAGGPDRVRPRPAAAVRARRRRAEVLHRSVVEDHPGTYNVAGAGVLMLSQAIRRAGRIAVPVLEPGLSGVGGLARPSASASSASTSSTSSCTAGSSTPAGWSRSSASRPAAPPPPSTTSSAPDAAGGCRREQLLAAEQAILDGIRRVRAGREIP